MRGKTRLYFVPPNVKMNRRLFIYLVLRILVKYDILRLYPGEKKNFTLHFNSPTAYLHPAVAAWLQKRNINVFTKEERMANSPDLSPLDYVVNGIFKDQCRRRKLMIWMNW